MMTTQHQPLVSVGIPTYNRPERLQRTLECITTQTYANLEIVVSDNCSEGEETSAVVQSFMKNDHRIKFHRQKTNLGAAPNFKFLLEECTGDYFMWAADDDIWEPFYIEKCLEALLQEEDGLVAVTFEAQYFSNQGDFDFFPEGAAFYQGSPQDLSPRLSHMAEHYYGNLIYGLFKRSALFEGDASCFSVMNLLDLNPFIESPLLLFVTMRGRWKVLPDIGIHKSTHGKAYARERWRRQGGRLPDSSLGKRIRRFRKSYAIHMHELRCLTNAIKQIPIDPSLKQRLCRQSQMKTRRCLREFMIGWKNQKTPGAL
jgi:glycosyltransferase involved in cell wall biosynthesis